MTCRPCPRPATPPETNRGPAPDTTRGQKGNRLMSEFYHEPTGADNLRPFDAAELSALTGWNRRQIYDLANRGDLPVIRVGGRVFFPRPAILRLLAAGNGREEAASA